MLFVLSRHIKGACFHQKEQRQQITFGLLTLPMLHRYVEGRKAFLYEQKGQMATKLVFIISKKARLLEIDSMVLMFCLCAV